MASGFDRFGFMNGHLPLAMLFSGSGDGAPEAVDEGLDVPVGCRGLDDIPVHFGRLVPGLAGSFHISPGFRNAEWSFLIGEFLNFGESIVLHAEI